MSFLLLLFFLVHLSVLLTAASSSRSISDDNDSNDMALSVVTKELYQTHYEAATLCRAVDNPELRVDVRERFEMFEFFQDDGYPNNSNSNNNRALLAKVKNLPYCFVAFSGTRPFSIRGWLSNIFPLGQEEICNDSNINSNDNNQNSQQCCRVRKAFYNSYNTSFQEQLKHALHECTETYCSSDNDDSDEDCVILTGLSQGGAIAQVAALDWWKRNDDENGHHFFAPLISPQVVTFGAPLTVFPDCPMDASNWYRYINTRVQRNRKGQVVQLLYDPIPFLPGYSFIPFLPIGASAEHRGHLILIGASSGARTSDSSGGRSSSSTTTSDDHTASLAYMGLDSQRIFTPLDWTLQAHFFGLVKNLRAVKMTRLGTSDDDNDDNKDDDSIIVPSAGFSAGSLCSEDTVCASRICSRQEHHQQQHQQQSSTLPMKCEEIKKIVWTDNNEGYATC